MSGGSGILNEEHTEMAVDEAKAAVTLDLFRTLIEEDLVPAGAATTVDNDIRPNWYSQKLACMFVSTGTGEAVNVKNRLTATISSPLMWIFMKFQHRTERRIPML